MKEMNNQELIKVNGGFSVTRATLIAMGITFAIGIIDGLLRPLRCNRR